MFIRYEGSPFTTEVILKATFRQNFAIFRHYDITDFLSLLPPLCFFYKFFFCILSIGSDPSKTVSSSAADFDILYCPLWC